MKKMTEAPLRTFRDRLELPIRDDQLAEELPPYAHPGVDSPEYEYLMERRRALGGHLPERVVRPRRVALPGEDAYRELLVGTGDNVSASTTGAFSRLLRNLMRDPDIGPRVVPIIPDEARTFGIDGLFRQFKIYAALSHTQGPQVQRAPRICRPVHGIRGCARPHPRSRRRNSPPTTAPLSDSSTGRFRRGHLARCPTSSKRPAPNFHRKDQP
jgi:pyruvate dehydrogenase complex dehydrogenase (E1) component